MFPNPSNSDNSSFITFEDSYYSNTIEVTIFDITGKLVVSYTYKDISSNDHTRKLNTNDLSKGVYMVKVSNGNTVGIKKLVIN